jgi:hypothetical protein
MLRIAENFRGSEVSGWSGKFIKVTFRIDIRSLRIKESAKSKPIVSVWGATRIPINLKRGATISATCCNWSIKTPIERI